MKTSLNVFYLLLTSILFFSCSKSKEVITIGENTYELVFEDNFNGTGVQEGLWDYRTDSKHWSTQKKENIRIEDWYLFLDLKKEKALDKEYTGAGLISKQGFSFGYYEAKMKVPKGAGWHSSFWLMYHDGSGGTNTDGASIEIDIVENDSKNGSKYISVLHKWEGGHETVGLGNIDAPGFNEAFQTVACEYTPDYVRYYLNGNMVKEIKATGLPLKDLNIWLTSIASHLGGTERVDDSALPSSAVFDYVRYYEYVGK